MKYDIQGVSEFDYPELMKVWEASVRATHDFLAEEDIVFYRNLGLQYLAVVRLFAVRDAEGAILGFLGVSDDNVEMLFIRPDVRGRGVGSALLNYAIGELHIYKVDVNEQNAQAAGFYFAKGFAVAGRSEVDGSGKPYPHLHLELQR